jgi:ribosomal protein S18 acetylase RimI-like enzyme
VDWSDALDLLGQQPFLLTLQDDEPIGCLACPPDVPGIAWLRLFVVAPGFRPADLWDALWPQAAVLAKQEGVTKAVILLMGGWMVRLLIDSGFSKMNSVVFLEWHPQAVPEEASPASILRPLRSADIRPVIELDNQAFDPLWQYSEASVLKALSHSSLALVAELQEQIAGYMLVSSSALGAHIARLAVSARWQGRGIGGALVRQAMRFTNEKGFSQLTVNTQSDNLRSRRLYHRLGFRDTDQSYPVWELAF